MEPNEAQAIIDLIGGAVNATNFNSHTYELWMSQLEPLDAELATVAALAGIQDWNFFPAWAKYYEYYQAERRSRALDRAYAENASVTVRGRAPEWAFVWLWVRYMREPREERAFPQQEGWVDPGELMSMNEYEELRTEWVEAGEPKVRFSAALAGK